MSVITTRHGIAKHPGQSLAVTECGITGYSGGHSYGPRIYGHYSAHFIISGKGTLYADGKSYPLSAGEGFMIVPDALITYTADENEPWTYIYANFTGADAKALSESAGLSRENMTFSYDMTEDFLSDLERMRALSADGGAKGYDVTGCFLLAMSRLVRAESEKNQGAVMPERYIRRAVAFIEDNYHRGVKITDIAKSIGVDRTYLYKLFKRELGISPVKYLTDYKLERAAALMEHDGITLFELAVSVGFCDESHFSKAFSKKFGCTPGCYRKEKYGK